MALIRTSSHRQLPFWLLGSEAHTSISLSAPRPTSSFANCNRCGSELKSSLAPQ
jgi:hypothetical protein